MSRWVVIAVVVLIIAVAGAILWVAQAPLAPPSQSVEQVIPDERLPH